MNISPEHVLFQNPKADQAFEFKQAIVLSQSVVALNLRNNYWMLIQQLNLLLKGFTV